MNFLNSFLGSSAPPSKMDSIVDTRRQLLAAMPKGGQSNSSRNAPAQRAATADADAVFLNSQLDGAGIATSGASNYRNNNSSTIHATSSNSFYHEDRLLDPDFIDHLAEYSDTEGGTDDEWGNFGVDGDDDKGNGTHLESGFTPENVFGPTEADASSKATGTVVFHNLKNSSATEMAHQNPSRPTEAQAYANPTPRHKKPAPRSAPQKRKSYTLTEEEPTMYIPDDMINIEAYMGPPSDICPPLTDKKSCRYSESESFDDSESEEEDAKKPTSSSSNSRSDHVDLFSNLAESSARTESTRRYLEESQGMSISIPDFSTYATSSQMSISSSSLLNFSSDPNVNNTFNSSGTLHHASHNSTSSFHTGLNSSSASLIVPGNNSIPDEHQTRMSNLLTAMERTEQSRTLLRCRSEAAASASSVSASSITSLAMGRIGGPRKNRGSSPPRSYQRLF